MAELYTLRLADSGGAEEEIWLRELDDDARARVLAIPAPLRRRQSLAGEHLARAALAARCGKAPGEITLRRAPSGQPVAAEGCVSISHSGGAVVCAVGDRPVGVDIEMIRPVRETVARRCFTAGERALLAAAPEGERERCFWRVWTGKEAIAKLSGAGVAALRRVDVTAPPANVCLTWREWEGCIIALAEEAK